MANKKPLSGFLTVVCCMTLMSTVYARSKDIDSMKSDLQKISDKTFTEVRGRLQEQPLLVWFYRTSDASYDSTLDVLESVAKNTKRMLTIGAVNCQEQSNLCKREEADGDNFIKIYPPGKITPASKYVGAIEKKKIEKTLFKLVPSHKVHHLTDVDKFIDFKQKVASKGKPKVIMVNDVSKKNKNGEENIPIQLRGLSVEYVFDTTVDFGYVTADNDAVFSELKRDFGKLKSGNLPNWVMYYRKEKYYFPKDEEKKFENIHKWINKFSESGMGDSVKGVDGTRQSSEEAESEMIVEQIRELNLKNVKDACFGQKNLCAVYLHEGNLNDREASDEVKQANNAIIKKLVNFEHQYGDSFSQNRGGFGINWLWLDVSTEKNFKDAIENEEKNQAERQERTEEKYTYPTLLFVKPPKKKREEKFLAYIRAPPGKEINDDTVSGMIDTIIGGPQFTRTDMPTFVVRPKVEKKAKKKDEL